MTRPAQGICHPAKCCGTARSSTSRSLDGDRPPHLPAPGPLESDDARLPDDRGPGRSRVGAVARARARRPRSAGLEGLFRSDHYQAIGTGSPAGSLDAWTTLAGLAARTTDAAPRDDGLARHVPARLGAREERRHRRPHLGRARRARHRRRLVRARARRLRLPVPDDARAARRARPAARGDHAPVDGRPTTSGRSRCSSRGRRSSSAAPRSRAPCAPRCASPTSTTPSSRRSTRRASASTILDAAAREAGRDPLVYSMMIGCLVGRDDGELERRLQRFRRRSAATRLRCAAPSSRSSTSSARTRRSASSG